MEEQMNNNTSTAAAAQVKDDLDSRYLTFLIENAEYGVSLAHVLEIINIQSITQVPHTVSHIRGIINLRGKVVPVLDTRMKLNKPPKDFDDKTCIIVITIHDMQVGLIVDSVSEVATIDSDRVASTPKNNMEDSQFLTSVLEQDDKIILNIDLEKFFQDDLFGL